VQYGADVTVWSGNSKRARLDRSRHWPSGNLIPGRNWFPLLFRGGHFLAATRSAILSYSLFERGLITSREDLSRDRDGNVTSLHAHTQRSVRPSINRAVQSAAEFAEYPFFQAVTCLPLVPKSAQRCEFPRCSRVKSALFLSSSERASVTRPTVTIGEPWPVSTVPAWDNLSNGCLFQFPPAWAINNLRATASGKARASVCLSQSALLRKPDEM